MPIITHHRIFSMCYNYFLRRLYRKFKNIFGITHIFPPTSHVHTNICYIGIRVYLCIHTLTRTWLRLGGVSSEPDISTYCSNFPCTDDTCKHINKYIRMCLCVCLTLSVHSCMCHEWKCFMVSVLFSFPSVSCQDQTTRTTIWSIYLLPFFLSRLCLWKEIPNCMLKNFINSIDKHPENVSLLFILLGLFFSFVILFCYLSNKTLIETSDTSKRDDSQTNLINNNIV